jgi:hypothetical protein
MSKLKGLPPFFEGKYERQGDCLIWTAAKAGSVKWKYGVVRIPGKRSLGMFRAHRLAWEHANDATIPDGMFVLHSCDVTLCVNPEHLRVGTPKENTKDMMDRGRYVGYKGGRKPKEFCKRGHKMKDTRIVYGNISRCGVCVEMYKEAQRVKA